MKIGILECGENRPDWARFGRFADWFPPLLAQAEQPFDTRFYAVWQGELPDSADECDAWLLTGSPASVLDDAPWQRALSDFLAPLVGRVPLIGICYGHQHLHHMLGGRVEECRDWGIGVHHYDVTALPDGVEEDDSGGISLIALHHDQVTHPAPGTRVLAGSAFCPYGITQIGPRTLTIQLHPEMDPAFAAEVYDFERQRIGEAATEAGLAALDSPRQTTRAAQWIMAFLAHASEDRT